MKVSQELRCPLCLSAAPSPHTRWEYEYLVQLYNSIGIDVRDELKDVSTIDLYICPNCELRYFYPFVPGSGNFYDKLQELSWYYLDDKQEYSFASQNISSGSSLLEVGCGRGAFTRNLKDVKYTGLELSEKAVEKACGKGLNVFLESIESHATRHERHYDVVCSFQVIEHVADINGFIQCCLKCLKIGGLLILSVPAAESYLAYIYSPTDFPPHHLTRWPRRSYEFIASMFKLEIVAFKHEPLADIHVPFIANQFADLWWQTLQVKKPKKAWLFNILSKLKLLNLRAEAAECTRSMLEHPFLRPPGHSMTVVYIKK